MDSWVDCISASSSMESAFSLGKLKGILPSFTQYFSLGPAKATETEKTRCSHFQLHQMAMCQNLGYENTFLGENYNGALLHKYSDVILNFFVSQRNNVNSLRLFRILHLEDRTQIRDCISFSSLQASRTKSALYLPGREDLPVVCTMQEWPLACTLLLEDLTV